MCSLGGGWNEKMHSYTKLLPCYKKTEKNNNFGTLNLRLNTGLDIFSKLSIFTYILCNLCLNILPINDLTNRFVSSFFFSLTETSLMKMIEYLLNLKKSPKR